MGDYRDGGEISIEDPGKPLSLLVKWINEAKESGVVEPNAMSLATVDSSGAPRGRMVLLKFLEGEEIGFFTNLESDKAVEILDCGSVAATMWWPQMERQGRMEGTAYQMDRSQVQDYHLSRARNSRIAAWASDQSSQMESKDDLSRRFAEFESKFDGEEVPLPPYWGGFRITVNRVEYWSGRPNRLHERIALERDGDSWSQRRLYP
ncbi:MAG: pyridoxamine 5'-phosphate oxidase [Euryarchaeota archaeon]|nr:pyridoxamine 5'-phosphate oxidase [Euryarchaeota archaeon]